MLKIVLLVVVNSKDIKEALKGINWHIHQTVEQHIWIKEEQIEIKDVVNEFVERHKPIEEYFFSAMGVRLQYLDSVIAEKVIKELTLRNIPCLAIHDSFITTRQEEQYLEEAMEMAIEEGVVEIVGFPAGDGAAFLVGRFQSIQRLGQIILSPTTCSMTSRDLGWSNSTKKTLW